MIELRIRPTTMFLGYFRMPAKGHSKFQCVEEPNHSIAIQNAYFRLKKQGMLSSLRAACFLHKGTQKTQKNNPVWSIHATKIAIHCIFTRFVNTEITMIFFYMFHGIETTNQYTLTTMLPELGDLWLGTGLITVFFWSTSQLQTTNHATSCLCRIPNRMPMELSDWVPRSWSLSDSVLLQTSGFQWILYRSLYI
jgi:hypothetical protein